MSIIILKQGGLIVVVCVWAQQGKGEQRKRLWFFLYREGDEDSTNEH